MSDLLKKIPSGEIVAENVSAEDYLAHYTGMEIHYEWVEGFVLQMSPNTIQHNLLINYFNDMLRAYFHLNSIGVVHRELSIRLSNALRVPDLAVILASNSATLTATLLIGAADICIEVVSEESVARDYADKLLEYETSGISEYWVIDPLRHQTLFYRLQENGFYERIAPDETGNYQTPLLPKLKVHVPTLWQTELPNYYAVGEMVRTMLAEE